MQVTGNKVVCEHCGLGFMGKHLVTCPNNPNRVSIVEAAARPAILVERGKTHGDFTDNAQVMQATKHLWRRTKNWDSLSDVQREALDMIAHKVGRILSGNPNIKDHWTDIAGYAHLVEERVKE